MTNKKTVLTGDRPTGPLHLGHYVGSLQNRVKLQSQYDDCFYMVADVQALTDNYDNPQKVRDNVIQVLADNIAVGVDPTKTTMFIQSMVPEIAELTVFFSNLVTVQQLMHNPTIKTEAKQNGFSLSTKFDDPDAAITEALESREEIDNAEIRAGRMPQGGNLLITQQGMPLGFLSYPVSQAADILFAKASIIPVGEDQRPHIEFSREIARKFNNLYKCNIFPEPEIHISETPRLVGTDGNAKASKSLGNAIYLGDSPDEIENKVKGMFTCPSKIRVTDAITDEELSKNVVFQYLYIFDSRTNELSELKIKYMAGDSQVGDSLIKKRLVEVLRELLDSIRAKREELLRDPDALMKIALEGSKRARLVGEATMREVRAAMKIDY